MEERVTFPSAGLDLAGILHRPDDLRPGERRAAIVVLHGFGGSMQADRRRQPGGAVLQVWAMWRCGSTSAAAGRARASVAG